MSYVCTVYHPREPDLICNRTKKNHPEHSGYSLTAETYINWTNDEYVAPPPTPAKVQKDNSGRLKALARKIKADHGD